MTNNQLSSLNQSLIEIKERLINAKRILIVSHEYPDPDATGSSLSLYQVFKNFSGFSQKNLEVFCYLPTPPPKYLDFLPGFLEIKTEKNLNFSKFDTIFCLDYGDFRRLRLPNSIPEKNIITIDHHLGDQRGQIKLIQPQFSSTAEIIYYFLKGIGAKIDKEIATCLLTGIVSDTAGFCHQSISPQTLRVSSDLLSKGVPFSKILRQTSNFSCQVDSLIRAKILGQVLSRAQFDNKNNLFYSWLNCEDLKKHGAQPSDLTGISSFLSLLFPANFTLFLVEYQKGKIKGSLRIDSSIGKNAAQITAFLGGGGHPWAAGFKQKGTIEEVLKKVVKLIE